MSNNKIIRLNIGGTTFKCYAETLQAFPDSKLANLDEQTDVLDSEQNEYFFDRNPILFAYILDSFRKGAVHIPKDICGTTFRHELDFWNISPQYVAPCCIESLYHSEDDIATVNLLIKRFQQRPNRCLMLQEKLSLRSKLWLFLDEPGSSRLALLWYLFISCVTAVATLSECLTTMDTFHENFTEPHATFLTKFAEKVNLENATLSKILTIKPLTGLLVTNAICNTILTLELVLCFIVCQRKKCFLTCFIRIMTSFGYVSYWVSFTVYVNLIYLKSMYAVMVYLVFGFLSIFRLARLLYLTKCVPAFQLISLTFGTSKKELKLLVFLLGLLVCVFGYLFFAAELFGNTKLRNVFTAIYWALITLTTVGYGDYVPKTAAGHVIAGACAICGVIVLALPVGIIISKFYRYYDYHGFIIKHAQVSDSVIVKQKLSQSNTLFSPRPTM